MNPTSRTLVAALAMIAAMLTLAPVCVLSGGDSKTLSERVELGSGALVEVVGENAEVRVHSVSTGTLDLKITMNNREFVDFYTQSLSGNPVNHFVISATTSTGGQSTANSVIELGVPNGVELAIRTTNRAIFIDGVSLRTASITTSNAPISVANSAGNFDLNTTNSEVTVQSVDGRVNVATTNAHIWFQGTVDRGINSLVTTNGDVVVRIGERSDVFITGTTHNGDVSIGGDSGHTGIEIHDDTAVVSYSIGTGVASLNITSGPGAIHINPKSIAVFDGDS